MFGVDCIAHAYWSQGFVLMPKFDLWSDLHVDCDGQPGINFTPQSDMLVLAGDISNDFMQANHVIDSLAPHYKTVVAIRGNHEHYLQKTPIDVVENVGPRGDNVRFLTYPRPFYSHVNDDKTHTLFLGLTGWYDFNYPGVGPFEEQKMLANEVSPDMEHINFSDLLGSVTSPEELALAHAHMLKTQVTVANFCFENKLSDAPSEIVIVTHTVPHVKGVVEPSHPYVRGNGSFYNSHMKMVWEADKHNLISTWCFGHTHFLHDFSDHGIRFVCNPRGRWDEQKARGRQSFPIVVDTENERAYK